MIPVVFSKRGYARYMLATSTTELVRDLTATKRDTTCRCAYCEFGRQLHITLIETVLKHRIRKQQRNATRKSHPTGND